jgi:alpha-tubulin suppressor-like RCC1 family protein
VACSQLDEGTRNGNQGKIDKLNLKWASLLLSVLAVVVHNDACGQNVIAWGANTQGQCNVPSSATNIVAAAAGGTFSIALRRDGSVVKWGTIANPPANLTNAAQIAAGYSHCIALRPNGTLAAWGNNNFYNQLIVPATATNIIAIAAGYNHNLVLRGDGTVIAWGRNDSGECNVPTDLSNVVAIAAGEAHSLALKDDGTVVIWGNSTFYPELFAHAAFPSASKDVLSIAAGANHNLAIRPNGKVTGWGYSGYGQTRVPKGLTNVIAIAGGTNYSIALKTDGSIVAWGYPLAPAVSIPSSATNIMAISSGPQHCLAITGVPPIVARAGMFQTHVAIGNPIPAFALAAADSYEWLKDGVSLPGATNAFPQIPAALGSDDAIYTVVLSNSFGIVTNVAGQIAVWPAAFWGGSRDPAAAIPFPLTNASALAAGAYHCLALNTDGTIVAWGKNTSGQTNIPSNATNIIQIAAGSDHSLALTRDGNVIAWGRNWDGQTNVPASATSVISIAAGWAHCVALRSDGSVISWGNNDLEQTNVPFFMTNGIQIAAGYYHTLALRNDHTVVSWGLYSDVPTSASNVVAIAAGYGHSLALRADGTIVAWGDNYYGQANVPTAATNVIAIAAGYYHSLALRADGSVLAWGRGYYGTTNLPGLPAMASLSAGEDFTIGLPATSYPQITRSPDSVTVHVGAEAVFTAEVTGAQPLTLQWLHDGIPVGGATNRYLVLDNVQMTDAGDYTLTITNSLGQATSAAATLSVLREPYVVTSPIYTSVLVGQSFCIPALVTGEQPISYQWRKNGIAVSDDSRINGSTSSVLCISSSDFPDGGDYQLVLNNADGSFTGLVTHVSITPIIGWGDDFAGQLDIPPDTGQIIAVAAGDDHTLAVRVDGRVVAWGDNTFGQTSVPSSATNIVAIAAYGAQSMALTADGNVLAWGENRNGLTNVPSFAVTTVQIATSDTLSIVTRADKSIKTWGPGMGNFIAANYSTLTLAIAAGQNISMRLDQFGNLLSYGLAPGLNGPGYTAMAPGPKFIAGLKATGVVVQGPPVGGGSSQFTVPGTTNVAAIAMGQDHIPTLQSNGVPVVFGSNSLGQTNVPSVATNVVAIAAAANHNLALLGNSRPAIAQQSSTRAFTLGDSTLLVAPSIGNAPATYQWQLNGTNIPLATTSYLMISPIRWTNAGTYRPIISDAFGTVVGPATVLNVQPPVLQFDISASSFQPTNGVFQLHVVGTSGTASTILYSSPDLINWNALLTNWPPRGAFDIAAPIFPDQPQMFYRIGEVYNQ